MHLLEDPFQGAALEMNASNDGSIELQIK